MRLLSPVLSLIALLAVPAAIAQDAGHDAGQTRRDGQGGRIWLVQDRPFGGPPPSMRKIDPKKRICRTPTGICELDKPRPPASDCACRTKDGEVVDGKVE